MILLFCTCFASFYKFPCQWLNLHNAKSQKGFKANCLLEHAPFRFAFWLRCCCIRALNDTERKVILFCDAICARKKNSASCMCVKKRVKLDRLSGYRLRMHIRLHCNVIFALYQQLLLSHSPFLSQNFMSNDARCTWKIDSTVMVNEVIASERLSRPSFTVSFELF